MLHIDDTDLSMQGSFKVWLEKNDVSDKMVSKEILAQEICAVLVYVCILKTLQLHF